jgi:dTDP-4-amino-4,6-dideoxygalactose transaminase
VVKGFDQEMLVKLVILLPENGPRAEELIMELGRSGIECQRGYKPLHTESICQNVTLPKTEELWPRVVCIPVDVIYGSVGNINIPSLNH